MDTPSYHDLYITTKDIPRTSIFNLPYGLQVICTRVAGWELWRHTDAGDDVFVAGEFSDEWFVLDVSGHVILDTRPKESST